MTAAERAYTAFVDSRRIASGTLPVLLPKVKTWVDRNEDGQLLIFDDENGRQVDFDFSGSAEEVVARAMPQAAPVKPGRPHLGVIGREVSLLPRHWEWLEAQPNGISATLRRLVDEARKHEPAKQRARAVREAASRFLTAMAGNLPGYEEACRALFAPDEAAFTRSVRGWPADIRKHALRWVREASALETGDDRAKEGGES